MSTLTTRTTETWYKIVQGEELFCTDETLPEGFVARGQIHGNNMDRTLATAKMQGNSLFVGPQGDGEWASRGTQRS